VLVNFRVFTRRAKPREMALLNVFMAGSGDSKSWLWRVSAQDLMRFQVTRVE
jgi:hypothetical protein